MVDISALSPRQIFLILEMAFTSAIGQILMLLSAYAASVYTGSAIPDNVHYYIHFVTLGMTLMTIGWIIALYYRKPIVPKPKGD